MAFVLAPTAPIAGWLAELDRWIKSSPDFFSGKPIILDLAALSFSEAELSRLIASLSERSIRIMGLEGLDPSHAGPSLPPLLRGGRPTGDDPAVEPKARGSDLTPAAPSQPTSLLVDKPIRSGQSVAFAYGDVTVLGSVSSGAEVVAGGSIHIYGVLRGRAMAGSMGNAGARIFCSRNEAELIAIDGYYRTAEDMPAALRNRAVQCSLEDRVLLIAALD